MAPDPLAVAIADIDRRIARANEIIAGQKNRIAAQHLHGKVDPQSQELLVILEDGLRWMLAYREALLKE